MAGKSNMMDRIEAMLAVDHGVRAVLAHAANNDLYRVSPVLGSPPLFRTRSGGQDIYTRHVLDAIALGLLGPFQPGETLPDGTRVNRIDLSDAGLETYLALLDRA